MSAVEYRFIEPLDVLYLRGNKLFGDPGSLGESLIPPWPSVAAGAFRSRILADDGVDLDAFARNAVPHPSLGTPGQPGSFAITAFHLARRLTERTEILVAPPADLIVYKNDKDSLEVTLLTPTPVGERLISSSPLPLLPVLAQPKHCKAVTGFWLTQSGWQKYLSGGVPDSGDLIPSARLWTIDPRVGVGLDNDTGSAADGSLFSTHAIALTKQGNCTATHLPTGKPAIADFDVGFLAGIRGASVPKDGLLRLGGDGRAAAIMTVVIELPQPDYEAIAKSRRCRIVLTTPGLFPAGWKLPGTSLDNRVSIAGIRARLVCASVPHAEVISGWDLANRQPKAAQRVAATGSVYWLDELEASAEDLCKLAESGLWDQSCEDSARRAEGFNRFCPAPWKQEKTS